MRSTVRLSSRQRLRLRELLDDCLRRSASGDPVDQAALAAAHPDLMPALADELRLLRLVERAAQRAREESSRGASLHAVAPSFPLERLDGYRLVREIHRGGQGVVYEAVQESTRRTVAVKVLREGPFASPRECARFDREVEILAQLRHPNIVTVHDKGQAAGLSYYVMDYVAGVPLDQWSAECSERDPRGSGRFVELFIKVCDAVHAAHLRGVIHRDLKPGNILVVADDEEGTKGAGIVGHSPLVPRSLGPSVPDPMILDFGLAKDTASDGSASMTAEGQFIGSLPWASPEQVEGVPGKIDIRTDVYALGVVFYQALTGRFPYPVAGSARTVMDHIQHTDPAPLRAAGFSPALLRRGGTLRMHASAGVNPAARRIDDDLETIVLRCLQKAPERRYQSAGEVARDLRHYLAGEPIDARRDSSWYVMKKLLRRHRPLVFAVGAVTAALVLGVIGTTWQAVQASRERDRAAEEALRARATTALLQRVLEAATPEMARGENPTVREMLDAAARDLEHNDSLHPVVAADTHRTLADAYYSLGEFTRAEAHARRAVSLRPTEETPRSPDALEDATTLARILSRLDRDDEAVQTAHEALHAAREDLGPDHPTSINLAVVYAYALGNAMTFDQEEMLRWSREGYERSAAVFGSEDHRALLAASDFGVSLMDAGQLDEAERILRSVLEIRQRDLGDDHPDVLVSLNNVQAIRDRREDLAGARELGLQIIEHADRILGPDHPRTCRYACNLAMLCARLGRFEDAESFARRAFDAAAPRLGPAHPDVLKYRGLLSNLLIELKRTDEAAPLVQEQYELCVKEFGPRHPHTIQAISLQFDLAQARGDLDELRRWADELKGTPLETPAFEQLRAVEAAAVAPSSPGGEE